MDYIINRKTVEGKIKCSECQNRIFDSLQVTRSKLVLNKILCKHCYTRHTKNLHKQFTKISS